MKHLGDITKISGYSAPIVDCIIGGSPCQDLSVAGKRAGLDGERSGLYIEQVRIVKEMRERDKRNGRAGVDVRPRYMVWENVPGAFSSNKGEDFRIVLEELAKVNDENAVIPMPDKGKWTTSGCILGDGWSIAWRVLDAQFWGVPQRRRRIALVADFGGHSAPEILFVRKSVSGYFEPSKPKRKESASDAEGSLGADDCVGVDGYNGELTGSVQATLGVNCGMSTRRNGVLEPYTMQDREGKAGGGKGALIAKELSATLRAGFAQTLFQPMVYALDRASFNQGKNAQYDFEISDKGVNSPLVAKGPGAVCYSTNHGTFHTQVEEGICATLQASDYKDPPTVCYCGNGSGGSAISPTLVGDHQNRVTDFTSLVCQTTYCIGNGQADAAAHPDKELCKTLNCMDDPMKICIVGTRYIVRRLTPLECERLQGYPDGWTDIGDYIDSQGKKKTSSDAARYKALGNSIALPPWKWVLKRLCACYERDATMASLFDGIGGFPLLWEQINGKGSCLWASEIEEFPIAVTKARIGE